MSVDEPRFLARWASKYMENLDYIAGSQTDE
jgi:hypothetical protein